MIQTHGCKHGGLISIRLIALWGGFDQGPLDHLQLVFRVVLNPDGSGESEVVFACLACKECPVLRKHSVGGNGAIFRKAGTVLFIFHNFIRTQFEVSARLGSDKA